jgi:hypothetical protein
VPRVLEVVRAPGCGDTVPGKAVEVAIYLLLLPFPWQSVGEWRALSLEEKMLGSERRCQ